MTWFGGYSEQRWKDAAKAGKIFSNLGNKVVFMNWYKKKRQLKIQFVRHFRMHIIPGVLQRA